MNATPSLIQNSSKCEKSQNAIDEFMMNSRGSEAFLHGFTKTVGEEDVRSTNQQEFHNLVEN